MSLLNVLWKFGKFRFWGLKNRTLCKRSICRSMVYKIIDSLGDFFFRPTQICAHDSESALLGRRIRSFATYSLRYCAQIVVALFSDFDQCPEILAWVDEIFGEIWIWRQNWKSDFHIGKARTSITSAFKYEIRLQPAKNCYKPNFGRWNQETVFRIM